ncbi:hypothetical protein M9H77_23828 [Catharanthus roseus]|uniref:Uncharacterized protein n=1 Tax=Catharanthus roseus TaxID=4058 RepID=A0ACC0AW48_CATRO|nr:hypothetical protein M9H77_23828 [Catharanthus roseus]
MDETIKVMKGLTTRSRVYLSGFLIQGPQRKEAFLGKDFELFHNLERSSYNFVSEQTPFKSKYKEKSKVTPPSYNALKFPLLLLAFEAEDYIVQEERVEALFYSYGIWEEDKVSVANAFCATEPTSDGRADYLARNQSQFLNSVATTCGMKPSHGMGAKVESMGHELSVSHEDIIISFSINLYRLCHELSFKELKLFLLVYASYMVMVGGSLVMALTFHLALDVARMSKCLSSRAHLEKQLFDTDARIKLSYFDLELLHDDLIIDLIIGNTLSSCASMWSKIYIFLGSLVGSGYAKRVN